MSNLLKEASILLTPTAYDNGRMLAVKPEIAFGEELVVNGDFATDTDWFLQTGVTISGGKANWSNTANNIGITQNGILSSGKVYRVEFTISNYSSGSLRVRHPKITERLYANGTYVYYITAENNNFFLQGELQNGNPTFSVDNVSVKEDLSGDFTFSRNSAATRVNAQGLVENVQILSSNLVSNGNFSQEGVQEVSNGSFSQEGAEEVTNGDFANDTDWSKGSGWSIADGKASCDGNQTSQTTLQSVYNLALGIGNLFKITFDISNYSSGQINVITLVGTGGPEITNINANGSYTAYSFGASTSDGKIQIIANSDFIGSIDNVSVKEVGQDWDFVGEAELTEQGARILSTSGGQSYINQDALTNTKSYKLSYEITDNTQGSLKLINVNGVSDYPITSSVGTHTEYFTANNNTLFIYRNSGATDVTITNISVKEVGQNWNLGTGWSIGEDKAINDGNGGGIFPTPNSLTSGAIVKFQVTISDRTNGYIRIQNPSSTIYYVNNINTNGTFEYSFTTIDANGWRIEAVGGFNGSITNISVIEITDDTNLPRINYEGFSYQDSLGSELVTNGDFATDSDWVKQNGWSISGGNAIAVNVPNTQRLQSNGGASVIGKTYKYSFEASNISGFYTVYIYGVVVLGSINTEGLVEGTFVATSTNAAFYISGATVNGLATGKFDNVSVKEYLGQEVVPNSGCGSWLMEPQSTNLALNSETFSSYGKSNVNISGSSIISPDGTSTAIKLALDNGTLNSNGGLSFSYSSTAGEALSWSMFVKKAEYRYLTFSFGSSSAIGFHFDLDTGLITQDLTNAQYTLIENKIESFNNGWYRLSVSLIELNGASTRFVCVKPSPILPTASNNNYSSTGDGTSGIYVWGAQLEQKSYPTSYIPTSGATSTRLQDIANNSGNASLINSESGVLYFEGSALSNDGGGKWISLSNGTTSERVSISYENERIRLYIANSSGAIWDYQDYSENVLNYNKIALKYKSADYGLWINGIEVATNANTNAVSGLNSLQFNSGGGGSLFFGKTKALAVYKTALTDANLRCLTYPPAVATTFDLDFDTIAEQFTFTRGSEATFVNAQGLIQSTNETGSELVVNGDFATDSDWNKSSQTTISNGSANILSTDGSFQFLQQNGYSSTQGKTVSVTVNITDVQSGQLKVSFAGGGTNTNIPNTVGSHTVYVLNDGTIGLFSIGRVGGVTDVTIDNVSVKEYTTATNTPRLDYSTGSEAFLLEPQSTNLITYSEDFSNASWGKNTVVVTSNTSISPNGNLSADTITGYAGSNVQSIFQLINFVASNKTMTFSVYLKGSGSINLIISNFVDDSSNKLVTLTNEWVKYNITKTFNNTVNSKVLVGVNSLTPSTATTLDIWGAQLEEQSYATSYIPTSGAIATRNQELCNNATPVINSEEGTLYAEIAYLNDTGVYRTISINDGTNNNLISIENRTTSNQIKAFVVVEGVTVMSSTETLTDVKAFNKIAIKWKQNNFSLWVNGVKLNEDFNGDTFSNGTLTKLNFNNGVQNFNFEGNTKGLKVYPKALADVQLEDLTTI